MSVEPFQRLLESLLEHFKKFIRKKEFFLIIDRLLNYYNVFNFLEKYCLFNIFLKNI